MNEKIKELQGELHSLNTDDRYYELLINKIKQTKQTNNYE